MEHKNFEIVFSTGVCTGCVGRQGWDVNTLCIHNIRLMWILIVLCLRYILRRYRRNRNKMKWKPRVGDGIGAIEQGACTNWDEYFVDFVDAGEFI